jgi:hypothetical protein
MPLHTTRVVLILLVWLSVIGVAVALRDSFAQSRWHFLIPLLISAAALTLTRARYLFGYVVGCTVFGLLFSLDLTTPSASYYSAALCAAAVGFGGQIGMAVEAAKKGERRYALVLVAIVLGITVVLLCTLGIRPEG